MGVRNLKIPLERKIKIRPPSHTTVSLPPTPVSASSSGQPTLPSASGSSSSVVGPSTNSSPHIGGVATPGFPTPVTPNFTTLSMESKWGGATPGRRPSPPSSLPAGSISGRQQGRSQQSSPHLQEQSQYPLSSPVVGLKRSRSPSITNSTREARHFEHQHLQQGGTMVVKDPRIKQHRPNNNRGAWIGARANEGPVPVEANGDPECVETKANPCLLMGTVTH